MSGADDCIGGICGGCCLILGSALTTWCNLHAFGSDTSCWGQGCCNSCFKKSFDEDNFDEQMKKEMERTRQDPPPQPVDTQPVSQSMSPQGIQHQDEPPREVPQGTNGTLGNRSD
ncbi:hypothetical protein BJ138DRAFT_1179940 [Hygrophoropsis aurantiaca]|uniref:Uncharacterized protein n=1 Tax=Hygrophoropsis aurantiaca TaxID=72124 RepID=A0ACB8AC89_9AGAM|nr:hypothetical protein BJ138DRAFT_1179940 [Hygrophoropsis aurantiaca]